MTALFLVHEPGPYTGHAARGAETTTLCGLTIERHWSVGRSIIDPADFQRLATKSVIAGACVDCVRVAGEIARRDAANAEESAREQERQLAGTVAGVEARLRRLRSTGWTVAVHNDYRMAGRLYTFWLFTRGEIAIKGEGFTDVQALAICEEQAMALARSGR